MQTLLRDKESPMTKFETGVRLISLAAVTLAVSAGGPSNAAPRHRGPTPKVIRPSLSTFPDRPDYEVRGPVGLSMIADATWAGPALAQPQGISWVRPEAHLHDGFGQGPQGLSGPAFLSAR
jgi:hypothetical protein